MLFETALIRVQNDIMRTIGHKVGVLVLGSLVVVHSLKLSSKQVYGLESKKRVDGVSSIWATALALNITAGSQSLLNALP